MDSTVNDEWHCMEGTQRLALDRAGIVLRTLRLALDDDWHCIATSMAGTV